MLFKTKFLFIFLTLIIISSCQTTKTNNSCPKGMYLDPTNICYDPCGITPYLLSLMQKNSEWAGTEKPICQKETKVDCSFQGTLNQKAKSIMNNKSINDKNAMTQVSIIMIKCAKQTSDVYYESQACLSLVGLEKYEDAKKWCKKASDKGNDIGKSFYESIK